MVEIQKVMAWGALALSLALSAPAALARPAQSTPQRTSKSTPSDVTTKKVEQLYAEGAAFYRAGKYRSAITRFKRAYALFPEPNLLYNMGRCREATGEVEAAIKLYERFVVAEGAAAHIQVKARARLKMLRAASAQGASGRRGPSPASAPAAKAALAPAAKAPAATAGPEPAPRRSSAITVTKWFMGGLAVAAAAGGTVAYLLGAGDHAQVDDAIADAQGGIVQMTRIEALELQDSGDTKQIVGYALWGTAAAALVTSAVLFAVDGGSDKERASGPSVTLVPTAGGVLLSGRF